MKKADWMSASGSLLHPGVLSGLGRWRYDTTDGPEGW
jgi:hypothetical protein